MQYHGGGVQRGHAYQCDALLLVRTCTYLPTWWTNWTLAREWNDVCSFSNDPFRHCSANNRYEHTVLYKRVRYVYTVSGFCITRAYRQRTVQARRLVSCITYSIRAVLFSFCILKCSTSFPKALQCLSAISCSKLSCMTRTIDISINVATSTCIKPGVCLAVFKTTVIFLQSLGSYWRNK